MYPSVPGFDVPLGKGGCTQKCSVIRSCPGPCNYLLCHSTGFGNVGTSVCALSKQTNNAYISNQNSRGVPKNNTHARTRALTMTSPCIHYHHQCHLQVVTMLLSRDADVNHVDSAGATALDFVMKAKNHTMARLLLSAGADPDHHAARTGTHTIAVHPLPLPFNLHP